MGNWVREWAAESVAGLEPARDAWLGCQLALSGPALVWWSAEASVWLSVEALLVWLSVEALA